MEFGDNSIFWREADVSIRALLRFTKWKIKFSRVKEDDKVRKFYFDISEKLQNVYYFFSYSLRSERLSVSLQFSSKRYRLIGRAGSVSWQCWGVDVEVAPVARDACSPIYVETQLRDRHGRTSPHAISSVRLWETVGWEGKPVTTNLQLCANYSPVIYFFPTFHIYFIFFFFTRWWKVSY